MIPPPLAQRAPPPARAQPICQLGEGGCRPQLAVPSGAGNQDHDRPRSVLGGDPRREREREDPIPVLNLERPYHVKIPFYRMTIEILRSDLPMVKEPGELPGIRGTEAESPSR